METPSQSVFMGTRDGQTPAGLSYAPIWNAIPILTGILDPLQGVLTHVWEIFRHPRIPECADSPMRRRRGLVIIAGGIEGPSPYNHAMCMGMLRSRWRGAVVRFKWNGGIPFLRSARNLMSRAHHERQSDKLARMIVMQRIAEPDAPIHLIAQSGGCWIVIRALEKLPPGVLIQSAVLLCPSISPGCDTATAAAKCTDRMVSMGSPGDFFFLGLGTLLFGTSDRVHTPAAGWVGWHHHPPGFIEARWHPAFLSHGYVGNHVSTSQVCFIRDVIAPMLMKRPIHRTPVDPLSIA